MKAAVLVTAIIGISASSAAAVAQDDELGTLGAAPRTPGVPPTPAPFPVAAPRVDVIRSNETGSVAEPTTTPPPTTASTREPNVTAAEPAPPRPTATQPAREQPTQPATSPALPRPPAREPTEFQLFAATSVGKVLPIFGQDIFATPATYAPVIDVPPSADYLVGPGDELVIRGWGQVDIDVRAVVSREGTVHIPRVGQVSVAGTRFDELQDKIKAAVGRNFRNFNLSVSLGRLRSIQVFIVGRAQRPGVYTVSSLATILNALFASGGPSATGSMRRIELRRGGKVVGDFDLYEFLLKGDKSRDLRLLSGDVLFIAPLGPVAAIAGPVKTQAVFELLPQGTTLRELIEFAGGLATTAATRSILLERVDQDRGRVVQDLEWSDAAMATPLRDGDVIQLRRVSPRFDNAVTVRGSVIVPFRTAWREGLRVSNLIPDRSALVSNAYWARAASRAIEATSRIGQEKAKTDIENLVDEVNWDYAVVERLDPATLKPTLIPFDLGKAVNAHDPVSDVVLQPGDIVTVFSQKDILTPVGKRTYFVKVEGEVRVPGIYQMQEGETLRQLVARAGGLTPRAYLFGAEFNRERVRVEQQARLEEITTRAEQEMERTAATRLSRASGPEEVQSVTAQIQAQRTAIARIRSLKATGRMVLDVQPRARTVTDLPDIPLEGGDRFFVPFEYGTVGVYGAVYNQSNFVYQPGKTVDDYLMQAGGPTRSADDGSTYVLRADGSILSRHQVGWFSSFGHRELMPNDSVVVPEEYAPTSWVRELKDWSQIFFQFGIGIAALKVMGL